MHSSFQGGLAKWAKRWQIRTLISAGVSSCQECAAYKNVPTRYSQDVSPQARETKAKINHWYYTKIKIFCTAEETINKMTMQSAKWKKILTNDVSVKGLISKISYVLCQEPLETFCAFTESHEIQFVRKTVFQQVGHLKFSFFFFLIWFTVKSTPNPQTIQLNQWAEDSE